MVGITGKVLVLFIVPLILYVGLLPVMPLMEPDEGRYSAIPSAMNQSGDYITPRLKGAVYIEKPPLAYWATALFFKIFGENEFSSRLFAGLCAWGCVLLVFTMGRFFGDENSGLYGAAILTTSLFHFAIGRINILDMPMAFFLSLAIWFGYRYCIDLEKKGWLYLCYGASALAFLVKGLIGILFPAAIIVIWLIIVKRWRHIYKLISPLGIIIFLVIALPWLILIQKAHGDFFRFFFIQEHLQRYTTTIHHRDEPIYYYLPIIILGTIPWCAYLWQALKGEAAGRRLSPYFRKEVLNYLLVWIGFITIFFSLSSSKLIPYIGAVFLPLSLLQGGVFSNYDGRREADLPGKILSWERSPVFFQSLVLSLGLVLAPYFDQERTVTLWWPWIVAPVIILILLSFLPDYVRRKTSGNWFMTVYLLAALFLGSMVFPLSQFLSPNKSAYALVGAIKKYVPPGQEVYQYDMSLYGIDFYGKMRTPVVDDIGEVRYGSEFLPPEEKAHYFLTSAEFIKYSREKEEIYSAAKGQANVDRLRKEVPGLTILWDNKFYYLLKLKGIL